MSFSLKNQNKSIDKVCPVLFSDENEGTTLKASSVSTSLPAQRYDDNNLLVFTTPYYRSNALQEREPALLTIHGTISGWLEIDFIGPRFVVVHFRDDPGVISDSSAAEQPHLVGTHLSSTNVRHPKILGKEEKIYVSKTKHITKPVSKVVQFGALLLNPPRFVQMNSSKILFNYILMTKQMHIISHKYMEILTNLRNFCVFVGG